MLFVSQRELSKEVEGIIYEFSIRSANPQSDVDSDSGETSSLAGYGSVEVGPSNFRRTGRRGLGQQLLQSKANTSDMVATHIKRLGADSQKVRSSPGLVILCAH